MGFEEWHSTQAQVSTSVPNCGCFPPANWTKPSPPPVFPDDAKATKFPHEFPGENCVLGGGFFVNESMDCVNYWTPNATDGRGYGVSNLTAKIEGDDGEYLVSRFDDFVGRAAAAGRPFLSALWMHYIHLPHPAMPAFFRSAQDRGTGDPDYVGALEQWDSSVGKLQDVLKKHGVWNDTLFWITSECVQPAHARRHITVLVEYSPAALPRASSDCFCFCFCFSILSNGPHCDESPAFCGGPVGAGRSNGGLRGCKASAWEGGIRVPGLVQWPARIRSGRRTAVPAVTSDILPTIMDITGAAHPHPNWPLDGTSLLPFFDAADAAAMPRRRQKPIGFWWGGSKVWIDNDMKVIGDADTGAVGAGQGCTTEPPYSKAKPPRAPLMFNLTESPTESVDVHAQEQGGYAALYARYATDLRAWTASVANSAANESRCGAGPAPAPPAPTPPTPPPLPTPPPANCTFLKDVYGFGGDGFKRSVGSKEACCAACIAVKACTIAVYKGGVCHGKTPESKGPHPKPSPGAWSCRARPAP
eukprot:g3969.t1